MWHSKYDARARKCTNSTRAASAQKIEGIRALSKGFFDYNNIHRQTTMMIINNNHSDLWFKITALILLPIRLSSKGIYDWLYMHPMAKNLGNHGLAWWHVCVEQIPWTGVSCPVPILWLKEISISALNTILVYMYILFSSNMDTSFDEYRT